jgi:hypothetical protein
MTRWRAYWVALVAALLGVSLWTNWRTYRGKESKPWIGVKSLVDAGLVGLFAWLCPPLLIGFIVAKILDLFPAVRENRAWSILLSIVSGAVLGAVAGWFLEFIVIAGVWAIDLFSGSTIRAYRKHRAAAES